MNKTFLLIIIFLGNSCFAADASADFFRVANEGGATGNIVTMLAITAESNASSMKEHMDSGRTILTSLVSDDSPEALAKIQIKRCEEGVLVELGTRITRDSYEKNYKNDSFTQCSVLLEFPEQDGVGVYCRCMVPVTAYKKFVDGEIKFPDVS